MSAGEGVGARFRNVDRALPCAEDVRSCAGRQLVGREPCGSPFAHMRAAVDVQHLTSHLAGFRQINNGVDDVVHIGNPPQRLQRL